MSMAFPVFMLVGFLASAAMCFHVGEPGSGLASIGAALYVAHACWEIRSRQREMRK
mgnify:CR=1 FL=1